MKTLKLIGMAPLVLVAATSFAQGDNRAVPRGGGGGGGSDAGSRHTGGGSSSGSSAGANSGNHAGQPSASGGGSQYNPSSGAQGRRPRPGTGTGTRDRYGNDYDHYNAYPYSSYYYNPYAYSWGYYGRPYGLYGYGYGYGYYDYGFGYGDYYGYSPAYSAPTYRYRSDNVAQVRLLVEPVKARVYVDGYYAGIVDDFDGLRQRLNVSPGRHDITLKLEGYTSHTVSTYVDGDQTIKLRFDMVKGNGETRDSMGEEYAVAGRNQEVDRDSARDTSTRGMEVTADRTNLEAPSPFRDGSRGALMLDVDPPDASVYVDGEFYGKASQVSRIELPIGRHRIEVVRPGYRTWETEVNVDGEARRVSVRLDRR